MLRTADVAPLTWQVVDQVQQVVYVARRGESPVAILELVPGEGYRLLSCRGALWGMYATLDEGQEACAERIRP